MELALWTRGEVTQFIEREFGQQLSICTTGEYLRRLGFTPQKSIQRACAQRPKAVKLNDPSHKRSPNGVALGPCGSAGYHLPRRPSDAPFGPA